MVLRDAFVPFPAIIEVGISVSFIGYALVSFPAIIRVDISARIQELKHSFVCVME